MGLFPMGQHHPFLGFGFEMSFVDELVDDAWVALEAFPPFSRDGCKQVVFAEQTLDAQQEQVEGCFVRTALYDDELAGRDAEDVLVVEEVDEDLAGAKQRLLAFEMQRLSLGVIPSNEVDGYDAERFAVIEHFDMLFEGHAVTGAGQRVDIAETPQARYQVAAVDHRREYVTDPGHDEVFVIHDALARVFQNAEPEIDAVIGE